MTEQLGLQQVLRQRGAVDRNERPGGALAVLVDQADDDLLSGAALAVDQDRGIEGSDSPRHLEHLPHSRTLGDEVPRGRGLREANTQSIQLAFAASDKSLSPLDLQQLTPDEIAQPADLLGQVDPLEVAPKRLEPIVPAGRVPPDRSAVAHPLAKTGRLDEVDFVTEAGARIAAGVADQRPADRLRGLAVVLDVPLRDVRIVPLHFRVESPGRGVELQSQGHGSNDALQALERSARLERFD